MPRAGRRVAMSTTQRTPRRGHGLWMATALVIGNMIGSGVFLLPSSLATHRLAQAPSGSTTSDNRHRLAGDGRPGDHRRR